MRKAPLTILVAALLMTFVGCSNKNPHLVKVDQQITVESFIISDYEAQIDSVNYIIDLNFSSNCIYPDCKDCKDSITIWLTLDSSISYRSTCAYQKAVAESNDDSYNTIRLAELERCIAQGNCDEITGERIFLLWTSRLRGYIVDLQDVIMHHEQNLKDLYVKRAAYK